MVERPGERGSRGDVYVVASGRPWNRTLAARLQARTGFRFEQISEPENLTGVRLAALNPRFVFVPHWSHRIAPDVYDRYECVLFHMTDVPFGRGGSPLQNLVVRGHATTVVSALRCGAELDAGSVYLRKPLCLHGSAEEIFVRADAIIEDMVVEILEREPVPALQVGEPTVFRRRTRADGALSGKMTLEQVYDHIRMLDAEGYPPAFVEVGRLRFEFTRVGRRADRLEACVTIRAAEKDSRA